MYLRRAPEESEVVRFLISPPEGWTLPQISPQSTVVAAPVAVSPDGRRIAFIAVGADGTSQLWIRSLDTLGAQALPGTERGASPFWSPDSRSLGFFADGKLKRIDISGGPTRTVCDVVDGRGGSWSRDGVIVFNPGIASPLQKVSAGGGVPSVATELGQGEGDHRQPFFLPDSGRFLYLATAAGDATSVYVASVDSTERKLLVTVDSSEVVYSQSHLLFVRETTLMAQAFDTQRLELTGEPFPIAEQIQMNGGGTPYAIFSASANGTLAYQAGASAGGSQLVWLDRTGKRTGTLGDPAGYRDIQLAPDGKRVAVAIAASVGSSDIWLYDVARGLRARFTFDAASEFTPVWSPDGASVVFRSNRKGPNNLYRRVASGAGSDDVVLEDSSQKFPTSWSPDGRSLLYTNTGSSNDLFVLPMANDRPATGSEGRKPIPFLQTPFNEGNGQFSPDGRWVAYRSNDSGAGPFEIYVVPFPGPGGKWLVSTAGGDFPRWRRDGTEIFYLATDSTLMAASVNGKGSSFEVGAVTALFQMRRGGPGWPYDVSPDGRRFLVNALPEQQDTSTPITVVMNWQAALSRR